MFALLGQRLCCLCNRRLAAWIGLIISCWALSETRLSCAQSPPPAAELLLRGAMVLDGTGNLGSIQDVAIGQGNILAVGDLKDLVAEQTIDCQGLMLTPGFIDLHNHSDDVITAPATRAAVCYLLQGCTSLVTGNCGSGPVDVAKYLGQIDNQGAGTNILHLLPHGDLRTQVMGKVAREPSADELDKMRALADEAMRAGAWGMSTGLIYVPGTYAKTAELVAIAQVIGQYQGIYASHIRSEGSGLIDAVEEALSIGRAAELPVHVSHFKSSGRDNWGRLHVAAELIEAAQRSGQKVTADQYPYVASSTSLEATLLPAWSREGGRKQLEQRLATPAERAKIAQAVEAQLAHRSRIQIAAYAKKRAWVGKSIEEIATLEGRPAVDIVLEIEAKGGAKVVNFGMSEDDVRLAMRYPWVATASDGGVKVPSADKPHPRSFGTFSRKLGLYTRQEKVLDWPQAVRSCSGLPADIIGLSDRGYIKPGYVADIAIFDPNQIEDRATYEEPFHYSAGMKWVLVNGVPAVADGVPTGALAGKALRKPR